MASEQDGPPPAPRAPEQASEASIEIPFPKKRTWPFWMRLAAYYFLALVLLGVYQLVFLARTSASRDWNHLHRNRLTKNTLQRRLVRGVEDHHIRNWARDNQFADSQWLASELAAQGWEVALSGKHSRCFASVNSNSTTKIPKTAPWTDLVAGTCPEGRFVGTVADVGFGDDMAVWFDAVNSDSVVVAEWGRVDPQELAKRARSRRASALLIHGQGVPLFGKFDPGLPTAIIETTRARNLKAGSTVALNLKPGTEEPTVEAQFVGMRASETVVLGSSRDPRTAASLLETARLLGEMRSTKGWRPYRTVKLVFYGAYSGSDWVTEKGDSLFRKHALAYISCDRGDLESTSPLLKTVGDFALSELPTPRDADWQVPQLPFGQGDVLYRYGTPVLSPPPGLEDVDLSRVLGLLVSELANHGGIPFHTSDYAPILRQFDGSLPLVEATIEFDYKFDTLEDEYTREYPWYAGLKKIKAVFGLKLANLRLLLWERNFLDEDDEGRFHHTVFGLDKSRTKVALAPQGQEKLARALEAAKDAILM